MGDSVLSGEGETPKQCPPTFAEVRSLTVDLAALILCVFAATMQAFHPDELYKSMVYIALGFFTKEGYKNLQGGTKA